MSAYDRNIDQFGAQLQAAGKRRATARRRRGRAILVITASAVAVAGTLTLALGGDGPANALAQARSALDPRGVVIYSVVETSSAQSAATKTESSWTTETPRRWRLSSPQNGAGDTGQVLGGTATEFAYAAGKQSTYRPRRRLLAVTSGFDPNGPASRPLGVFGAGSSEIRKLLRDGKVEDRGELEENGRRVRRLVSVQPPTRQVGLGRELVYDVDPETFDPIAAKLSFTSLTATGSTTSDQTTTFRVRTYKRLPATASNLKLLQIPAPADARVVGFRLKKSGRGRVQTCARPTRGKLPPCP